MNRSYLSVGCFALSMLLRGCLGKKPSAPPKYATMKMEKLYALSFERTGLLAVLDQKENFSRTSDVSYMFTRI